MDYEAIDDALAAKIKHDFDKLLMNMFTTMKDQGYIRDDLNFTFTGDPHMLQFYQLFFKYVMGHIMHIGKSEPSLVETTFIEEHINDDSDFTNYKELNLSLIREIVSKKKEEMILDLINKL